ncbi:MAG TPA: HD domain-containing phosphohydrolase [Anaerolineales bacterium]
MLTSLLNNLPGMAYRCQATSERQMELISEGSFELTGYPPENLMQAPGLTFQQLMNPGDREAAWESIRLAIRARKAYDLSYRIQTSGSQEKWVRDIGRGVYQADGSLIALQGFITDITDRKLSEQHISRQMRRFEALRKIDIAITASFDLRVTLDILLDQVMAHLEVDASDILLLSPYTQTLEYSGGRGFRTKALQHTHLPLGDGLAGKAALERRTIHIADRARLLNELRRSLNIASEGFNSYFGVPLIAKGQVKGILEVFHRTPFEPDADWEGFLETLAGQAAIAIDNSTLFDDLQRSNIELTMAYDATLEGWSKALELRHQETQGHSQRVSDLAVRLAQVMGIRSADLMHIRRGALLHDIGKMGIPDSILLKPGPLTPDEWETMRQHPVYAYQLLSAISYLRSALDIPLYHHEHWDGTGYPRGLKGDQIPLAGRIFAVVDVWDALIKDRPYNKAWPPNKVLEYIREQAGRQFDPTVVQAFLNLMDGPSSGRIM